MHPRAERKARIRRIRREHLLIEKVHRYRGVKYNWRGNGYRLFLIFDGLRFEMACGHSTFYSFKSAHWFANRIAIALNKLKFGD